MKKSIFLIITFLFILSAFKTDQEVKPNVAEVDQIHGCYVFIDSKPMKEYEYLGTVKKIMTWGTGQYQDVRDALLKKAKKEYPDANGMIFHFHDGGADEVDAIKFVE
ncbi:hypothetical protein GYB22_03460 [bacterium]|nr:hypothetical protein [bacterium]